MGKIFLHKNKKKIKVPLYLENTPTNDGRINLGIKFKSSLRIQLKHMQTVFGGGSFFGEEVMSDDTDFRLFGFNPSSLYFDFESGRQIYNSFQKNVVYNWEIGDYYVKDLDSGTYLINSTKRNVGERELPLWLWGEYNPTLYTERDNGRVYNVKIYDGDELIRDFYPYVFEDGSVGLYDIVNDIEIVAEGNMVRSSEEIEIEVNDDNDDTDFYIGDVQATIYLGNTLLYPSYEAELGTQLSTLDIKKTPITGLFVRRYGVVNIPTEGLFTFSYDINGSTSDYVVHINNYGNGNYVTSNGVTIGGITGIAENYYYYHFNEPIYFIKHNLTSAYVSRAIFCIYIEKTHLTNDGGGNSEGNRDDDIIVED